MSDSHTFSPALRFWLFLLAIATIFWLGGLSMRALIANEFFLSGTLEYDPAISLDMERILFQLIYAASITVLIAYFVVLVSAIVVVRIIPLPFKEHPWLLMASLLFFLFVPVEIFTGYLDVKYILLWIQTLDILDVQGLPVYEQHSAMLRETLSHRIGALGGLPVMAMFCYFTVVAVLIFQPLRKKPLAEEHARA